MVIIIPVSPFPNVPQLPGVPQIPRSLSFPPSPPPAIQTQGTQSALWHSTQTAPTWGVFDSNNVAVVSAADSVMDFGYRHANNISDFPVQQGQFATYNRVNLPFDASVTFTKGGTLQQRTTFLQQIDNIDTGAGALSLYKILTPEKTYLNVNVLHTELTRRGAGNACYFDVEVYFRQIQEVTAQYSSSAVAAATATPNAKQPSAVPFTNQGLVQPAVPNYITQSLLTTGVFDNLPGTM